MAVKKVGAGSSNENLSAEQRKKIKEQETARERKNKKILSDVSLRPGMTAAKKVAIGATVATVGVASALVPAKFVIDNLQYEISMNVKGVRYDSYSITTKRGTKVSTLDHYEITGYTFKGFYKDKACTVPYDENDKITKDTVVYCKYEPISYKVTYPEEKNGYIIPSAPLEVDYDKDLSFTIVVLDTHINKSDVKVYANGNLCTSDDGVYTVKNVTSDINITVEGIVENYYDMTATVNGQVCELTTQNHNSSISDIFDMPAVIHGQQSTIKNYLIETSINENAEWYKQTGLSKDDLLKLSNEDLLNVISTGSFEEIFTTAKDEYNNPIDLDGEFQSEDGLQFDIKVELATLNKLTFNNNVVSASDNKISGEVTMPSKYLVKNESTGKLSLRAVSKLNSESFKDCSNLTSVKIGRQIKEISGNPFQNCGKLTTLTVDEQNIYFTSEGNCVIQTIGGLKTLRVGCGSSVIAEDVIVIGEKAFYNCSNLTSVTLPMSVDTVSASAFENCKNLKSVTIPRRYEIENGELKDLGIQIYDNAFAGCSAAEELNLGAQINTLSKTMFTGFGETYGFTLKFGAGTEIIKSGAFKDLKYLEKVIFNEGLKTINAEAFSGCLNLDAINLPSTLTTIGDSAFAGCSKVTELYISESVTSIGDNAFAGLTKVNKLFYNGNITTTPTGLFSDIGTEADSCVVTISGTTGEIKTQLFKNCFGITSLVLGSVDTIGASAFEGCSNLTSVTFGEGLYQIEDNAFKDCSSLQNFDLPASLNSIGENVFANCLSLTQITIPAGIRTIQPSAFTGCNGVTEIFVNVRNPEFTGSVFDVLTQGKEGGITLYFNNEGRIKDEFFKGNLSISQIVIGENVDEIGKSAFAGCENLSSIIIKGNVSIIDNSAFEGCTSLTNITIPTSVTDMGSNVFKDCTALEKVVVNAKLKMNRTNAENLFLNCSELTDVTFGENLTFVPAGAFMNCKGLTKVKLSENVAKIYASAFKNTGLTSIDIPVNVDEIGENAFENCLKLVTVNNIHSSKIVTVSDNVFSGCSGIKTIKLPENLESIGNSSFRGCSSLLSIQIGEKVSSIGESAFEECVSLSSLEIPDNVTTLGDKAFKNCYGITSVKLGSGLNTIYANTFDCSENIISAQSTINTTGNSVISLIYNGNYTNSSTPFAKLFPNLESVVVGKKVKSIRNGEFEDCGSLKSVEFIGDADKSYALETIGNSAFKGTVLTSIKFPNTVTEIGESAFLGTKLTSLTIPVNIIKIGKNAFKENSKLGDVTIEEAISGNCLTDITNGVFAETEIESLKLPKNIKTIAKDAFAYAQIKTLEYDSVINADYSDKEFRLGSIFSYLNTVIMGKNVTTVSDYEFDMLDSLNNVTIGSKVTSVGYAAFSGTNITGITIPASVTTLSDYAFYQCKKLSSVTFENGIKLTTIGLAAFSETPLKSVQIPNSVQKIEDWAFGNCGLENISFVDNTVNPSELQTIGNYAFYNSKISSLNIPNSVIEIQSEAFASNDKLTNVSLGKGLLYIYDDTFDSTDYGNNVNNQEEKYTGAQTAISLTYSSNINVISSVKNEDDSKRLKDVFKNLTSITIGENVTAIKDNEFAATNIQTLIIPSNITTIGDGAFASCASLTRVIINGENLETSPNGIVLNSGVFKNCNSLVSAELNNVKTISENMFASCLKLQTLKMNEVETIGDYAFQECESLQSLNINQAINILEGAFKDCIGLTNANLTITNKIGANAFYGCNKLEVLQMKGVKEIGTNAFYNCVALKEIVLPNSLTSLGDGAFYGCSKVSIIENYANITQVAGEEDSVSMFSLTSDNSNEIFTGVGSEVKGGVTLKIVPLISEDGEVFAVKDNLFTSLTNVKEILIGENVQKIQSNAFGDSVNYVKKLTFNAKNAEIEYVTNTKNEIFANLGSDTSSNLVVELGEEVEIIPADLLSGCTKLKNITIPESVTLIGDNALSGTSLTTVDIPGSVSEIGMSSFASCPNLTQVQYKDSLTTIGASAFENCTKLQMVCEGLASDYAYYKGFYAGKSITSVGVSAFKNCVFLHTAHMVRSTQLTEIQESTFEGCSNMFMVAYSESTTKIGSSAFKNTSLKRIAYDGLPLLYNSEVIMSPNIESIGESAFENTKIEYFYMSETSTTGNFEIGASAFKGCSELRSVALKSYLTSIGASAFEKTYLKSITIPDSVTYVGSSAFMDNERLDTISFGSGLTSILDNTFANCLALKEITLPNNITDIDVTSFYGNIQLETLKYDSNIQVNNAADENDTSKRLKDVFTSLLYVTIGNNVTIIKNNEFAGTSNDLSIATVTLGSKVETIGESAFEYSQLTTVILPEDSLIEIGNSAFANSQLKSLKLPNSVETIGIASFEYNPLTAVQIGSGLKSIPARAFANCLELTNITFPSNIEDIYETSFNNITRLTNLTYNSNIKVVSDSDNTGETLRLKDVLKNLTSVTVGEAVIAIKDNEFSGTEDSVYSLKNVAISSNVSEIGESAFACSNLESIGIPKSVKKIEANAFANCLNLIDIELGDGVTTIGADAFINTGASENGKSIILKGTNGLKKFSQINFANYYSNPLSNVYQTDGSLKTYGVLYWDGVETSVSNPKPIVRDLEIDWEFNKYAFQAYNILETVSVNYYNVPSEAFKNCKNLKSFGVGDNDNDVTIGSEALMGCSALDYIYMSAGSQKDVIIEDKAFYECSKLDEIEIDAYEKGVNIGYQSFAKCKVGNFTINTNSDEENGPNLKIEKDAFIESSIRYLAYRSNPQIYTKTENGSEINNNLRWKDVLQSVSNLKSIFAGSYSVRDNEFNGVESIETLYLSNNIANIDNSSFAGCTNLKTLDYCSNINVLDSTSETDDGSKRLKDAIPYLTSVTAHSGVTTIKDNEFQNLNLNSANISISKITSIGANAFENTNITSITFPSTLTEIGESAFKNCSSLAGEGVALPDSLTSLGVSAFESCSVLPSVTFGTGLTEIPEKAFAGCSVITSLDLPSNITLINNDSFDECNNLKSLSYNSDINVGPITRIGDFVNGIPVSRWIYTKRLKDAFTNLTSVTMGSNVTIIKNGEFEGLQSLNEVDIKNSSISDIGDNAFDKCTNLENFIWNSSKKYIPLKSIGDYAFRETGLSSVSLANASQLENIGIYAFSGMKKLTSFTLNRYKTLTELKEGTFRDCEILSSFSFAGEGIEIIGKEVFAGCSSLTTIALPASVKTIHQTAFGVVYNRIKYKEGDTDTAFYGSGGNYYKVDTASKTWAYNSSSSYVKDLSYSSEITIEYTDCEYFDNNLTVNDAENKEDVNKHEKITNPYEYDAESSRLKDLFYDYVNAGCPITKISINADVNNYEFQGLPNLTEIILKEELSKIGTSAFDGCPKLETIDLVGLDYSNGITFSNNAFKDTGTTLGNIAGTNNSKVKKIYVKDVQDFCKINFGNYASNPLSGNGDTHNNGLYIDEDRYNPVKYVSITGTPNKYAFQGYTELQELEIEGPASIPEEAFMNCKNLQTLELSASEIGARAFKGCFSITNLTLNEGLISIGEESFAGCKYLTCVNLTSSLTTIGAHAFSGCTDLKTISIPESVTSLGFDENGLIQPVFDGCTSINSVVLGSGITKLHYAEFANSITYDNNGNITSYENNTSIKSLTYNSTVSFVDESENEIYVDADGNHVANIVRKSDFPPYDATQQFRQETYIDKNGLIKSLYSVYSTSSDPTIKYDVYYDTLNYHYVYKENENYISYDENSNYLFENNAWPMTWKYVTPSVTEVTANVNRIRDWEFQGTSLITLNSNRDMIYIGNYAFDECTEFGKGNFGVSYNCEKIGNYAFGNCESLKYIEDEGSTWALYVREIGAFAFQNCINFGTELRISTLKIGEYAFDNCQSIKALLVNCSVDYEIEEGTFAVKTLEASYSGTQTNVVKVTNYGKVGDFAFANCRNLTNLEFNIGYMGYGVFQNTPSLKSVLMNGGHLSKKAFYCDSTCKNYGYDESPETRKDSYFTISDDFTLIEEESIYGFLEVTFKYGNPNTTKTYYGGVSRDSGYIKWATGSKTLSDTTKVEGYYQYNNYSNYNYLNLISSNGSESYLEIKFNSDGESWVTSRNPDPSGGIGLFGIDSKQYTKTSDNKQYNLFYGRFSLYNNISILNVNHPGVIFIPPEVNNEVDYAGSGLYGQ